MLPSLAKGESLFLCLVLISASAPFACAQGKAAAPTTFSDISGMYSFLREGEFVQLTVEDGQLSGFVSRFGDTDSDKGEFIDHFFDKTSLQGDHLYFQTKTIHAVWYEFDGVIATGPGKRKGEEGYRVLRGKLTLHQGDATGKEQVSERTVELKSFPDAQHIRQGSNEQREPVTCLTNHLEAGFKGCQLSTASLHFLLPRRGHLDILQVGHVALLHGG